MLSCSYVIRQPFPPFYVFIQISAYLLPQSDTAMSDSKRKILLGLQFLKKLNRLSHLHCKDRRDMTQKVLRITSLSCLCVG